MSVDSGKLVAVKIVTPKAGAEYHRRRFLREMDHIVRLRHPNIAAVLKCGAIGKDLYFVTEYCGGGSLSQWMMRRGPLSLAYARPLMRECLDALKYAHLHQVIHDDLKPQNILWDLSAGAPVAKISDFGLARNLAAAGLSGMATAGARRAENCYTPRERLTSDHQSRPVSDLWSLAAVFYHALSGQLPYDFGSRDPVEVILTEDPVPLGNRDGSIPVGLAGVIDRALQTNPAHRYQSAAEMKAGLEQAF
jgi:serine/threonine protein kinase